MTIPIRLSAASCWVRRNPAVAAALPVSTACWIAARAAGIDRPLTPSAAALPCNGSIRRTAITSPLSARVGALPAVPAGPSSGATASMRSKTR